LLGPSEHLGPRCLSTPLAWTITFPDVALTGTGTLMLLSLQLIGVATLPLNLTVLVPCSAPKPLPAIVVKVPAAPVLGEILEIFGGATTVKFTPGLSTPDTVTAMLPVVAPAGTGATIFPFAQLEGVPTTPLNVRVLLPCVAPKFVPVRVTEPPIAADIGDKLLMLGIGNTVKLTLLLATSLAFTTTLPVVAPVGTGTTMEESLQLVGLPTLVLNLTVPLPCVAPNPLPVMATGVPTGAAVGERLAMFGAGATVNGTPALTTPETVTTTFPDDAPTGMGTTIFAFAQLVGVAVVPLNVTVLVPCVVPKLVPVTITAAPIAPDVGVTELMLGTGRTVKITPLLLTPLAFTTTFPVLAPLGAGTTMAESLQLRGMPALVPNLIVLVPCVAPNPLPATVTDVPIGAAFGDRFVMLGAGTTVKFTPLLGTPETVTTTFPLVAPVGTGTTILVFAQLVAVPATPLNVIVLLPCVVPKLVPATVMDAPIAPALGEKFVILGLAAKAGSRVKSVSASANNTNPYRRVNSI
jgi:hypothetical protein